jgi:hypothetical protein
MENQEIESQQEFNGYIVMALVALAITGTSIIGKKIWMKFKKNNQEVTE